MNHQDYSLLMERLLVTRDDRGGTNIRGVHMELADYLENEDITLAEFGKQVGGVEESTVARWRDGVMFPSPDNVRRIEDVTGNAVTYQDFQRVRDRVRPIAAPTPERGA